MIPVTFENKTTNNVKDSPDNLAPMENSSKYDKMIHQLHK